MFHGLHHVRWRNILHNQWFGQMVYVIILPSFDLYLSVKKKVGHMPRFRLSFTGDDAFDTVQMFSDHPSRIGEIEPGAPFIGYFDVISVSIIGSSSGYLLSRLQYLDMHDEIRPLPD